MSLFGVKLDTSEHMADENIYSWPNRENMGEYALYWRCKNR